MGSDPWIGIALIAAGLLLLHIALLSALETAVLNARRSRLAQIADKRSAQAEAIIEAPEQFQTSAHLAKSISESLLYAVATLIGLSFALQTHGPFPPESLHGILAIAWPGILFAALGAYLSVTIFAESLPKVMAGRHAERVLLNASAFIRIFTLLFTPVRWTTSRLARFFVPGPLNGALLTTRAAHSEEEIKLLVEGSAEEGVLEEEEMEMIHSIFEFTDTVARQVMVPRIDIRSVDVNSTVEGAVQEVMESGHSRLPVCEGTLDNVVGIIHVKDLLAELMEGRQDAPIRPLVRDPFFVPEGKKLDELLQEFRGHKSQMAIVIDEFGGTSGLVTIEDVLEEIVGEIEDEYDVGAPPGVEAGEFGEGALVDGRMTIVDVNEELGLALPHGDYDTLGGFVFSLFGRPASPGERVEWDALEFVVEAVDGLRIGKVRVIPLPGEPVADEGAVS